MADKDELALFVVRGRSNVLQVLTEDEVVVLEVATWSELRANLSRVSRPADHSTKVVLLIGRPSAGAPAPASKRHAFEPTAFSVVRSEPPPQAVA